MTGKGLKDILQSAVQLNKDHQYALNVYTERLEAELAAVDKLLNAAEYEEEESHLDIAGCIQVSGATRPMGLLSATDLLSQDSPFYDDAIRRQRFLGLTEYHPMKHKELESLAEAVRLENRRLRAYETQRRGEHSFASQYSMSDLESTEGLDWERIADKVVTDSSAISQRSARECEIRWLGDRHPRFNHSSWPSSEIAAAKALVQGHEGGNIDWVSIAEQLGTRRTPIDVMRHAIVRKTHVWDAESDRRLVEAVQKFGTESWSLVARLVSEDAQPNSCQNRWYRSLDPSIRRGNWSPEEDAQLRLAVNLYGHAWMEVASVIPGRNNEQCRDRWTERLNPKVTKGKWTTEEDARLLSAVSEFGVGKWKEVSERIGTGRTDNTVRLVYPHGGRF
ncbi:Homeodomain-like protein [Russula earlei]|uniref:Homeodomain-like protein n=1 Tax=Russula earlei TaxID=71964 RepID=A0ACC0U880_9AGAM|nr:Homeodomain-like protein [Russula earlei]